MRLAATFALCLAAGLSAGLALAEPPTLTVYTYSSFTSEWGPGAAIKTAFEAECGCTLDYVAVDDGVALLSRLRLEGAATQADVVLGLDTNLLAEAKATGLFAPHGVTTERLVLPVAWDDAVFLPYDYGYFAFVYDSQRLPEPPASLAELVANPDGPNLLIQDPRTSTPGLGLLLWLKAVYGDAAAKHWAALQPRILTVTPGWSEAYGLFLQGEAPLVLSYTTSPAYHRSVENETRYAAAPFTEGHYLQVEVAARTVHSDNPALAQQFLAFMLTDAFQKHIPAGNWMYPVIELADGLPQGFESLIQPEKTLLLPPETVAAERKNWINEWLEALSR